MPRGSTRRWFVAAVAALVLVRVAAVCAALSLDATSGRYTVLPGDVRRFHQIATDRGTPYREFKVEYPPLTLAAIDVLDGPSARAATVNLMWSQLALDLLVATIIAWGWGRRALLAYLVLGLAFVWYPFLYLRLDLLSVALATGGLALVRRRKAMSGAALVGLACFAKLWPLALGPALAIPRRTRWRALAAFGGVVTAGTAAWLAWVGVPGPRQVLTFRGAKGWQVESTVGAVLHVFASTGARFERGAARIGTVPDWARVGLPLLGLLVVFAVWAVVARTRRTDALVLDGLGPVAAITAMLVCSSLLSPQYISWLLPFAAIAVAGGERTIGVLTAVVAALSTLELNLVKELSGGDPFAMGVVLVRNALLVGLLWWTVARIVRLRSTRDERIELSAATAERTIALDGDLVEPVTPVAMPT
jgi:hypothetical protein